MGADTSNASDQSAQLQNLSMVTHTHTLMMNVIYKTWYIKTYDMYISKFWTLKDCRCEAPKQDPEVLEYLQQQHALTYDINLEVLLQPEGSREATTITRSNLKHMWGMHPLVWHAIRYSLLHCIEPQGGAEATTITRTNLKHMWGMHPLVWYLSMYLQVLLRPR